ncbi:MAG: ribonuclease HII [Jaaginema sp. PMC 1080.18]|nr:ribonuclease HII [Jaaginema sp. PMC 1080.18]
MAKALRPVFQYDRLPELQAASEWIAGVDEVGRGALFGPVVAAAVMLPRSALQPLMLAGVRDSKQLSHKRRQNLAAQIRGAAIEVQIGYATVREIDEMNILQASLRAMQRSILKLKSKPHLCMIDGRTPIPDLQIPQQNLVGGDRLSLMIAAASIVAKVWRDDWVMRWAHKYPQYDLIANKGYGTQRHCLALQEYGPSPQHRLSFRPCQPQA